MKPSKEITETLRLVKKTGYGHFLVAIVFNGKTITTTTTNSLAVDCAFDEDYQGGVERFYDNREEAMEALATEILIANNLN